MPRLTRWSAEDAEKALFQNGLALLRSKASRLIYAKGHIRVLVPFHAGRTWHPKIIRQVLKAIEDSAT